MRLRSINVYSDYLGDPDNTKARTGELRADSDFLDYVFSVSTGYVDNSYVRQLNICCSPSVSEVCIKSDYPEGYPQISVPFNYSQYRKMSAEEKDTYWINTVESVFAFLEEKMNCADDKPKRYIACLRESDIPACKQRIMELQAK